MAGVEFVPLDGGYGWVVTASCILISSSAYPLLQCFALIFESTFQKLNIEAAEISFLLHLHNCIMCSIGFLCAPFLKKYSYKQLALAASFLISLGIFLTSFIHTYTSLIITVCLLVGTGQGMLIPCTSLAINSYFKKRLTLAMSFSVTGVGLFPIITPTLCNFLLNFYGTSGTILILAGLSLHCFVGALLLRPVKIDKTPPKEFSVNSNDKRESPEEEKLVSIEVAADTRLTLDNNKCKTQTKEKASKIREKLSKLWTLFDLELFKSKEFVFIIIGMGISYAAELNFILMTPFVLYELADFKRVDVALAMSIQSAFDITGRLVIPILAHKSGWHPKVMYAISLVGSSIGRTVLALFCDTRYLVLACSALWGLSKGAKAVFQALILPRCVPYEKLATSLGVVMVTNGSLSLILGPFIGWIHDISQSYLFPLHFTSLLSVSCIFVWSLEYYFCQKAEKKPDKDVGNSSIN